jgi:hypothetical protein
MANLIDIIDDAIRDLAEDTSPVIADDLVPVSRASDTSPVKVKLTNLVGTVLAALRSAFTPASSSSAASLKLHEDTDNGSNYVEISAPATLAANRSWTFDDEAGVFASKAHVAAAVVGLLDDKGNQDCSGNPNYPAALKGDVYTVSVAGKIGGASGIDVEVGDVFRAIADNAGGTQASVGTSWVVTQANLVGAATSSSTNTFTNKTFDAEATGNALTISEKQWLPAAGVSGATGAPMWDLPASNAPTATVITGSNVNFGTLSFPDSGASSAQITLKLPGDWSGAIDAKILWKTSATSGNCKWNLATSFTAIGGTEVADNAFNSAQNVTTAAPGTANRIQESDIASLTTTGASAGELMHLKISRDGTDGSDTIAAAAELVGVEITWRRTI